MKKSLAKNIGLLIVLSFLLKGIGFVNRIVIASYFGTTVLTDVFYSTSGFVESISSVFLASLTVGVINVYLSNKGSEKKDKFVSDLLVICVAGMLALSLVIAAFSGPAADLLAPKYSDSNRKTLSAMLRIMCITLPFQGAIAVYSSLLQAEQKFTPVKLIGAITSAVSILCVIVLSKQTGVNALVIAYVAGIVLNTVFLAMNSRKLFVFRLEKIRFSEELRRLLILIGPLTLGIAAHEVNLIVDKSVASGVAEGAVSALSYSCVLYLFVENIIVNSIVTAFFPNLTEKVLKKEDKTIADNTNYVVFFAEIFLIPIVIVSVLFSDAIVRLVYMRGNFNADSLMMTKAALQGYMIGLPFLAARNISMQVYYAYGDTKTPVKINLIAVAVNIILDVILAKWLGVFGITLATSISSVFSGTVLFLGMKNKNAQIINSKTGQFLAVQIPVTVIMVLAAWKLRQINAGILVCILTSALLVLLQIGLLYVFRVKLFFDGIAMMGSRIREKRK